MRERRKLAEAAEAVVAFGARQWRILVVEDDPDMQWRLARTLTVNGNRVVGTSSGDGALALMSEWRVDLVLVDDELHGTSGLDVARKMRETYPHVPVILMTGTSTPGFERAARVAGAAACLMKPFHLDTLVDLLHTLIVVPSAPTPAE